MLIEVLTHIAMFDVPWIAELILENLMWVFLLGAVGFFIYGKNPLFGAVFVALYLYATFDLVNALGWVFSKGLFWAPLVVFACIMIYDAFFSEKKWHASSRGAVAAVLFYAALFAVNVIIA